MNEYLPLSIIFLIYLAFSFAANRIISKTTKGIAIAMVPLYLITSCLYFEAINMLHHTLRDHQIYIDFGHADLLLIMLMMACLIIALINIFMALAKRSS